MVRLVFRPYTQVRRTICTSVSLRASTRVSSGFAPLRHVHHLSGPDRRAPTRTLHRRSGSASGAAREGLLLVSFLVLPRFKNPSTRTHVRLFGPCFKTGRMGSPQAFAAQHPEGCALQRARTGRADDGFQRHLRPLGLGRRCGRQESTPRADRRTNKTVPHTTGAHRRAPSASLPAILSTL